MSIISNTLTNLFLDIFPKYPQYQHFWIVDPASHGKGFFFLTLFLIYQKNSGLCDAKGSVIKRFLRDYQAKTDQTFKKLKEIANVMNMIKYCTAMILPHINSSCGKFLFFKNYSNFKEINNYFSLAGISKCFFFFKNESANRISVRERFCYCWSCQNFEFDSCSEADYVPEVTYCETKVIGFKKICFSN